MRSNRLILLIGLFLAVVAFVGVIFLTSKNDSTAGLPAVPTTAAIVVAVQDIPVGTKITAAMVATKEIPISDEPGDSFALPEAVIGKIVRTEVTAGAYLSSEMFGASAALSDIAQFLGPGLGAVSITVDEFSGVGTLVQAGDRVDVVLTMTADKNPIVVAASPAPSAEGQAATGLNFQLVNPLLNSTTVKVLVQNVQVLGTIAPAVPAQVPGASPGTVEVPDGPGVMLVPGQQIVIIALTAQQAELVRFAQLDGSVSLVLRSPKDKDASAGTTTGVTLRQLVDDYGVVPPKIILTEQP